MKKYLTNTRFWSYFLFWSWNAIFLAFMVIGFAPTVMVEMVTAVRAGSIPVQFLVYGLVLAAIPLLCVILGLTRLRHEPHKLFALGYGVEGPLMLMLAVRFFLIQDATPVVTWMLAAGIFSLGVLLWQLLDRQIDHRGPVLTHIRVIGLSILLVVGVYASLWIAFYALPIAAFIWRWVWDTVTNLGQVIRDFIAFLQDAYLQAFIWVPFMLLGMVQLAYTATLFILMPIAVPFIYGRAWWRGIQSLTRQYSQPRAVALSTAVIALLIAITVLINQQPQQQAFALLEAPPTTEAEAAELLAQEEIIRAGLLNAYLAQHRYLSAQGEMDHIKDLYREAFKLNPRQANLVQRWYEGLVSPLLYRPVGEYQSLNRWDNRVFQEEPAQAAELYERFFDQPIAEGEKEAVVSAVRSTWMIDQARAGWQAVDDREVYLAHQEITITEQGDWADVELYEVYENQTSQRQEVVYYFSLPETAVLTGLWLGNSDNRAERFVYQVAPRGAAQAVYRQEVQRRVDPALLEQIGPGQYRLRIFPVPPMTQEWDDEFAHTILSAGQPLHMWLSYQVMAAGQSWPLPYLAEQVNLFWDEKSVRLINGQPMDADENTWLPTAVPPSAQLSPIGHRIDFPDGLSVIAQPMAAESMPAPDGSLALAVVLDRSRSMEKSAELVQEALAQVGAWGKEVDVYLTAAEFRGEPPTVVPLTELNAAEIVYFGGQNAGDLLLQFEDLYAGQTYDAVLVITDGSGFGLSFDGRAPSTPPAPLWMIHVGGQFPLGYDDATLEAMQASGGGNAATVSEALARQAFVQASQADDVITDVADGYAWAVMPTKTADALSVALQNHEIGEGFAALAGRRQILAAMQKERGSLSDISVLDGLHTIAKEQGIITPYSSMIVLVEDRQQQMLDAAADDPDRFEREFEEVGETQQELLTVTGVPEPEEWLLMGLAAVMLGWYMLKQRCTGQVRPSA
jgi:putative PEP-CTERM system integral membrane protein